MSKKLVNVGFVILLAIASGMLPYSKLLAQKQDAVSIFKSMLPDLQRTDYQMEFRVVQYSRFIGMKPQSGDTSYLSCSVAKRGGQFMSKQGGQLFMLFDSAAVLVDSLQRILRIIDNPEEIAVMAKGFTKSLSPDSSIQQAIKNCEVSFNQHIENGQHISSALFVAKQRLDKKSYPVFESTLETVDGLPHRYHIVSRTIEMVLEEDKESLDKLGALLLIMPAKTGKNAHAVIRETVLEMVFSEIDLAKKTKLPIDMKDVLSYDKNDGWKAVGAYAGYVVLH